MTHKKEVIIATRGSKLALWQAQWVKGELEKINPHIQCIFRVIKTKGDKILDVPLAKVGGKGLFVKEIEEALLRNDADCAVHSMKDVPMDLPEGLHLSAICEREESRDAFVSIKYSSFESLPSGALVGTSSLRRSSQLYHARPDLTIVSLRGNLDTRLRKLDEGQYDAIILAVAGMERLGLSQRITEIISPHICVPAVGQGALGIECRKDDKFINALTFPLNHDKTSLCVRAERAFLRKLEGSCQVPIAAHAVITDNVMQVKGLIGTTDGKTIIEEAVEAEPKRPEQIGIFLAEKLIKQGAGDILSRLIRENSF
jgi:hydroxymethylbilane synthase